MKIWTRLGFAVLALAMLAALVFVAPAASVRAAPELACSDVPELCDEFLAESPCVDELGLEACLDFCYVLVYAEFGLNCNACTHADSFCDTACEGDPECIAECPGFVQAEFGLSCEGGCADDGRVNQNCSAPEIVYCNGDKADFYAYNYETLEGDFDFSISLADLQQSVDKKKLVHSEGHVKVYLMPDGRVLLVARQPDGKDYFMYWNPATCTALQEGAEWNVK